MKHMYLALNALLFFSATPTHSMGLVRAVKRLVKGRPQAQLLSDADVQACAQSAFAQTDFSPELLALVLSYCSKFKLGVITLPDEKKKKNNPFKYPKHSVVQVGLNGDILTVLTTANKLLKYQLPEGILVSQNPANLAPGSIYLFKLDDHERLTVDDLPTISRDGSVYVSNNIVCSEASNACYLAQVVGDLSELKIDFSTPYQGSYYDVESMTSLVSEIFVTRKYGARGICAIYSPEEALHVKGHCYYDNSKLPLEVPQPCTTIKISLQPSALARMLGCELAKPQNSGQAMPAAENKEEN